MWMSFYGYATVWCHVMSPFMLCNYFVVLIFSIGRLFNCYSSIACHQSIASHWTFWQCSARILYRVLHININLEICNSSQMKRTEERVMMSTETEYVFFILQTIHWELQLRDLIPSEEAVTNSPIQLPMCLQVCYKLVYVQDSCGHHGWQMPTIWDPLLYRIVVYSCCPEK